MIERTTFNIQEMNELVYLFDAKITLLENQMDLLQRSIEQHDGEQRMHNHYTRNRVQHLYEIVGKLGIKRKEKSWDTIQKEVDKEMRAQGLNPDDKTWEKKVEWLLIKDSVRYDADIKQAQKENLQPKKV